MLAKSSSRRSRRSCSPRPSPVSRKRLEQVFETSSTPEVVGEALEKVVERYAVDGESRGVFIEEVAGGSPAGHPARASRQPARLLRHQRSEPPVDGGARDARHRRLPPAGHRARDPGPSRRQQLGCSQDAARPQAGSHRGSQAGRRQAFHLPHHPGVPHALRARGALRSAAARGVRGELRSAGDRDSGEPARRRGPDGARRRRGGR